MKPSARNQTLTRRLVPVLGTLSVLAIAGPARAADDSQCGAQRPTDPRIAELLAADPDDPRIDVTSDTGELGRSGDATLSGNVQIRLGQRLLTADAAQIDAEKRTVQLQGDVEYLDPTLHVRGEGGDFSADGGSFEGAEFELLDRSVRGAARDVRLREQTILDLDGVTYTACPPGNDDWKLEAGRISINQDTRIGTGRDVRLDFKGVPILFAPWITFPVGDVRKSGLLFPTIGSSGKTGTQIAIPWYWNIAPNYDATFTPRYFSSRGLRIDPEFRYLTERSRGTFEAEYLFDDLEQGGSRSYVDLRHMTHFTPLTRLRIDAANASDNDYFEDFGVGFEGTSVTYLDRLLEARQDTAHWSLVGRVQNFQILDASLSEEDSPYSILPQLAAVGRWRDLGYGFGATVRAEAVNFQRDLGPQGQRFDVEPAIDWRKERGGAYVAASAAWRATGYSLSKTAADQDDAPSRTLPLYSVESGLVLERSAGSRGQRLQTLEPRAQFLYVPYRNQDELPVFDTALPDLNMVELFRTNRYVGADRVSDANQLSLGVTTRLLNGSGGKQFLSATLGQAIYFEDPRVHLPDETVRDRATSDIVAEIELTAYKNLSAHVGYLWNPDETQTERSEIRLQYRAAPDRVVNAGYRFRRDLLEQIDVSAAWPINEQWRGYGRWVYSLAEDKTLDQFLGIEYGSCCWAVRVVTRRFVSSRTGATDTSIGLQLELKGLSSVGVDYESFLEDSIRGYSALPSEPSS